MDAPEQLDDVREQAERLRLGTHRAARSHYLAGKAASATNARLGVPVVVLTAVAGTSIFASISKEPSTGARVATGAVVVLAAVMASVQTYFQLGQRADRHRASGARFAEMSNRLEVLLLRSRCDDATRSSVLDEFGALVDQVGATESASPDVPDRFWEQARREEASDAEGV